MDKNKKLKISDVFSGLIILLIIFLISVFLIYGFWKIVIYFLSSINKEIALGIIAGVFTILVSLISILFSKYVERKQNIETDLRKRRIPTYKNLLDLFFKILSKDINNKESKEAFHSITQALILWASDEVVKEWSTFYSMLNKYHEDKDKLYETLFQFEKLLIAIRKDEGYKSKKVKKGDLLKMFISDYDKVLENNK